MTEHGDSIKLRGWQVAVFTALLISSISGAIGNYLSFRDWRTQTNLKIEQMEKATYVPRYEYDVDRRYSAVSLEEIRARISVLESRVGK